MNWYRVAAASTLPIVLAAPIVALCFHKGRILTGTTLGSGVFFVAFIAFAAWEFGDALNDAPPVTEPSIFTKIVVYGVVAMLQVMALYLVSDLAEKRLRDRDRDPVWR
jgi:hypothetical protein